MKTQIGNKIFFNVDEYNNYKKYLDILNLPFKTQKLLWYTKREYIPNNFGYYDKFEDDEKICISNSQYNVKIGDNSIYAHSTHKSGLTIYKNKKGNQKLKLWYGTNILNAIKTLKHFNFINNDIITNDFYTSSNQMYSETSQDFLLLCTKGALNQILNEKIISAIDLCNYYCKYSLKLKKDIVDKNEIKLFKILKTISKYRDKLYVLRNLLKISKDKSHAINHIYDTLETRESNSFDAFLSGNIYGEAINIYKAVDEKVNLDEITLTSLDNKRKIINKKLDIFLLWNKKTDINFFSKTIYDSEYDLPF